MPLTSKTIEKLKDLVKEARDKGANEQEADDILTGFDKLLADEIAKALAPLQEKITANLQTLTAPVVVENNGKRVLGLTVARALRSFVMAEGNRRDAADWAKAKWGADELAIKTLTGGSNQGGGFLVSGDPAGEIIELLRTRAVVRSLGPMIVPMSSDSKPIPRIAGGATGSYVGESTSENASDLNFQQLVLRIKKLRSTVAISSELNDDADGATDQMVIDDIVAAQATTEDTALIRGEGTEFSPKGLSYWAANKSASVAPDDGSAPTLAEVRQDISDMVNDLTSANSRMIKPAWIMSNRTKNFLQWNVTDANENLVFAEELAKGMLNGWAVGVTNNVPSNLGGGSRGASELYLADMADVVVGDRKQIEFKISDSASFKDADGNTVSAFDNDLIVIRAIARHDMVVRHEGSVSVRTGLAYTAG